eukprot:CAMPEP_0113968826 /NCGR_PEP_ID=MMETSP0011_2-20120614/9802_1 /TAXON_ID=101924 /ORGANISM="Rhodosorus marinus" /LENGTH=937 /DNA_ID=CAMNT_0000982065 /DNA_START=341 /DNA_END=3154 /DNA_ORIENTATION=+ /assembly_acc=CAM_ASM_000156
MMSMSTQMETPFDTSEEMATRYDPSKVEQLLYTWWESTGAFKPSGDGSPNEDPFVISMPPPNVTGGLHMGHAMFTTLEDIMTRYNRMKGRPTLWLPGTDHAGIATQLQVEKTLAEEGRSRQEIGREAFVDRVWQWKMEKGGYITKQIRRLGASCDWSRERFTMDEKLCEAVVATFTTLHQRGLIYRGEYMVNWSPNLQTAVSDLEVEFTEEDGFLYHFEYGIADSQDLEAEGKATYLPVATTRPETILGDTAVCVHPEDERYKHLIGRQCVVPITGRTIPIITDDYVDMEFGTGALKITPGHDINDYEIGKRHQLETMCILNKDATMNELCGKYAGMDRFECRKALWKDLEENGIAIKAEKYTNRVPRSQRGGEVVEPLVSKQWFLSMESLAKPALEAVRSGEIRIVPERFERTYEQWLENIHDWCISRQLWWGHQIPVWYVDGTNENEFIVAANEEEAYEMGREKFGSDVALTRDTDVLDTWFSSGLWPFSALDWPEDDSEDLGRFYPTTVMETGYDILFFWVARMIMMGIELTGKVPFQTVYLHGLVRDSKGRKMSKTLGNVIDPLEVIDNYGTDALRYSLVTGSTPGQDISLSMERIETNRNFANKLWNVGRYIVGSLADLAEEERSTLDNVFHSNFRNEIGGLALPERYIISRLHQLEAVVSDSLESYSFGESGRLVHDFLWDEFADWYIETSKTRMFGDDEDAKKESRKTLVYVLDSCLRLLHPFMPFVTEALWQRIPHNREKESALISAAWPEVGQVDEEAINRFNQIQALTRMVRNARLEYQVEPQKKIEMTVVADDDELLRDLGAEAGILALMAKVDKQKIAIGKSGAVELPESETSVSLIVSDSLQAFLPMKGLVDFDKEIARLEKQLAKAEKDLNGLLNRLNSSNFAEKAPEHVVNETREQAAVLQEKVNTVQAKIIDVEKQSALVK